MTSSTQGPLFKCPTCEAHLTVEAITQTQGVCPECDAEITWTCWVCSEIVSTMQYSIGDGDFEHIDYALHTCPEHREESLFLLVKDADKHRRPTARHIYSLDLMSELNAFVYSHPYAKLTVARIIKKYNAAEIGTQSIPSITKAFNDGTLPKLSMNERVCWNTFTDQLG